MTKTMRAARLHTVGGDFQIDNIPVPEVRPNDVLVEVRAAGVVPNLRNVITHWPEWFPFLPLPKLPAIYGLDSAGVVAQVGSQVRSGIKPGDRVYVNPGLSCGTCRACRRGDHIHCADYTFMGYFGFGPGAQHLYEDYPYGGFGQFMVAPAANLVKLPDAVTFEQAARFGYLGTAYSALRKAEMSAGQTVLIDGGTGTLGVGGVILALAMGATKVFATGRNEELLRKLRSIDPKRIQTIALGSQKTQEVVMDVTDGYGVDVVIETLGPNADVQNVVASLEALRRGGKAVNVSGVSATIPVDPFPLMCLQKSLIGSNWFTPAEGEDMALMAEAGTLNLGVLEHERFSLDQVNEAITAVEQRGGGFKNVLVMH